jgi:seryl-tRNA synthetase
MALNGGLIIMRNEMKKLFKRLKQFLMASLADVQAALAHQNSEVAKKSAAVDATIKELKDKGAASPQDLDEVVAAINQITLAIQAIPES